MSVKRAWMMAMGALALAPAWCGAVLAQSRSIEVVSSPPEFVTTPGVLVRVRGADIHPVGWASNDTLITPFYQNEDGDWFGWIGLLDLLKPDPVQILTVVPDPRNPTSQFDFRVSVFAPDQPLFPGPRPPPAECQNQAVGFGPPRDAATCEAASTVRFVYRTTDGAWGPFSGVGQPGNVAMTTTSAGKSVPMIARIETGVINRAPYAIAILDDPGRADPSPGQPWPMTRWNGSLIYGAGDAFALGVQAETRAGLFDIGQRPQAKSCAEALLERGYAIAVGQNTTGPAPYDIVAAETLLRVRERFIKRYALPKATIGIGSGDAGVALARIAKAYPGLDSVGAGTDAALAAAAQGCR